MGTSSILALSTWSIILIVGGAIVLVVALVLKKRSQ
jgi:hypothetical protein